MAAEDDDAKISQAMRLADFVRARGDMSAAAVFYRRAHTLAPDKLEPMIGLAQSAAAMGANKEAVQFYRKAVAIAPDNAQVRLGFGRVLLGLDRPDLAAAELRAAIAADPRDHRAYVALGVALDLSCEQRLTQQVYGDGLQRNPGNPSLRNNLALNDSLRGVDGPRLAADVVCGSGPGTPMYSALGRERGAPIAGPIAETGRQAVAAAGHSEAPSWVTAEGGTMLATEKGGFRAMKVRAATGLEILRRSQIPKRRPARDAERPLPRTPSGRVTRSR
jgi:tetratricopeptide (TPR) repeat protein